MITQAPVSFSLLLVSGWYVINRLYKYNNELKNDTIKAQKEKINVLLENNKFPDISPETAKKISEEKEILENAIKNRPVYRAHTQYLKIRTTYLYAKIMLFLIQRGKAQPPFKEVDAMIKFTEDTKDLFLSEFSNEISDINNEFEKLGFRDKVLDLLYKEPSNPLIILTIADKIKKLAEIIE